MEKINHFLKRTILESDDDKSLRHYQISMNKYRKYSLDKLNAVLIEKKALVKRDELFSTMGIAIIFSAILSNLGGKIFYWILNILMYINNGKLKINDVDKMHKNDMYFVNSITGMIVFFMFILVLYLIIRFISKIAHNYRLILLIETEKKIRGK